MKAFLCGTESSLNVADCVVELKASVLKETETVKWEKIHHSHGLWEESKRWSKFICYLTPL